ncbi:enoyl-CoA hydratase/isomerase family protein [Pseudonocardia sp. GCM10023141]|uniref:enoyl-CoA hydratase/isomerase family protein n=1 Tax=Pseudonocardia sp. GCM10023141 TaxID=3252653 RepID=UPI0036107F73
MSDTHSPLSVARDQHVTVIEISRPPANYFDEELVSALVTALSAADDDAECRAVVLCSAGRNFCAGADFGAGGFATDRVATAARMYRRVVGLFGNRKPIVAAIQRAAVGGGLGLACVADFRVADPDSRFVANFAALGFHQGFGLSVTLPAIVGRQHAADLLYRGATIHGERAFELGLVDRLVERGGQRKAALEWAHEIAGSAPLAVASIRETLRGGLADEVRAVLDRELAEQTRLWQTADSAEGIAAVLERRRPEFVGR